MNESPDPKALAQNILRVAGNLMVLLDIGLFPGKHAVSLEECRGMIKALIDDATAQAQKIVPPTPAATPPPA